MTEIRCVDGIVRQDTPAQAEIRKTKPWAQACPERFQFNGLPYVRRRRRANVRPEQIRDALEAARGVGRRRLQELRHTVQARKPFMQKSATGNGVAQLEFLHSEKDRKAAQNELDMIEWACAASPGLDDEMVAYMLELDQTNPKVLAGFFGKLLSVQTPEQDRGQAAKFTPMSVGELLAEHQRLDMPAPDWLKEAAAKETAGKEPVPTATR
jgi:hypothetical protein